MFLYAIACTLLRIFFICGILAYGSHFLRQKIIILILGGVNLEIEGKNLQLEKQENLPADLRRMAYLKTNRSFPKCIIFSLLTFGIYTLIVTNNMVNEINTVCGKYDGKRSLSYFIVVLLSGITLGIVPIVWFINISNRMGNELKRRKIEYTFNAKTYLLWGVFGILLLGLGPILYWYKFMEANRLLNQSYNRIG